MKILSANQIREADAYTIAHEPIASIDLMERASDALVWKYMALYSRSRPVAIICGPGNNGGDGLAIGRMLHTAGYQVHIYILDNRGKYSEDHIVNRERLDNIPDLILTQVSASAQIADIEKDTVIVDAVFGTGLSRPVSGLAAEVIRLINDSGAEIVSVDIPSGLYTDTANMPGDVIVKATHTFTFQLPKMSFFYCSNAPYLGAWETIDIRLSQQFLDAAETCRHVMDKDMMHSILQPRKACSHKGTYGHALVWAGSYGKTGAAILCAHACLSAGAGLTTAYIHRSAYTIFQTVLPEVMVITDRHEDKLTGVPDLDAHSAIGIGPGIDKAPETAAALKKLLQNAAGKALVIDADALNLLAEDKDLLKLLPANSILTPHPKEFERLAGPAENDWQRQEMAEAFASAHHCILVLKGTNTTVNLPDGTVYYNSTGNPAMAKGGSGDALTGIITGLLAQKYTPADAARLGVYLHGLAGDIAAGITGPWSLRATQLIENIGTAFKEIVNAG